MSFARERSRCKSAAQVESQLVTSDTYLSSSTARLRESSTLQVLVHCTSVAALLHEQSDSNCDYEMTWKRHDENPLMPQAHTERLSQSTVRLPAPSAAARPG